MTSRLLVVVIGGWIVVSIWQAGLVGLAVVTVLGLAVWAGVQAAAFHLFARLR
jgi:hypothetical protein